ncbi:MAG: ATP-dependent DNA helicase, partial [Bacilli bacterium]|nr:ATP-dependent DNA helicase [Bacilli bacterium]
MSQIKLTISVHQLVDFLLRIGDIDNRIYNKATMLMGTKIHSYYQKKQNNEYISEYELQETFFLDNFEINLQGRADGIIIDRKNNKVIIDEIKSTVSSLEEFYNQQVKWHLGQAECYALMYAHEKKLDEIDIRLTYISQLDQKEMIKQYTFKKEKLEQEIEMMLREYLEFYQIVYRHTLERNKSLANLKFPFTTFRSGQRNLSKYVYGAMKNGGNLFVEAPTGIGKTMSTIYPSVLSFGSSLDKVFYVTAKTSGRESATKAIELLKEHGLRAKNIIITAKDKICFNPGSGCNPDECPYAKGYYGKIKDAITEMLINEDSFNYDSIVKHAMENDICPFEFQLDLSLYSDIIVCDYNYVFDPQVYLRRFFDDVKDRYGLLVDEAHNLIDRGREMFSASINLKKMENLKKSLKKLDSKSLKNCLNKIIKYIKQYYELKNENPYYIFTSGFDITIINLLEKYVTLSQNVIKNNVSI